MADLAKQRSIVYLEVWFENVRYQFFVSACSVRSAVEYLMMRELMTNIVLVPTRGVANSVASGFQLSKQLYGEESFQIVLASVARL